MATEVALTLAQLPLLLRTPSPETEKTTTIDVATYQKWLEPEWLRTKKDLETQILCCVACVGHRQ